MTPGSPFMKQLIAGPKPQAASGPGTPPAGPGPGAPMGPGSPVAAPFMPQMAPMRTPGGFVMPQRNFAQPQPQLPVQRPPAGPSVADQLQNLQNMTKLQGGGWTIDPLDPENLVQYSRRF